MGIYSKDLRIRAVAAVDRGTPRMEVVETFSFSLTTLKRWLKMRREGKDLSPGTSTGRRRRILATLEEKRGAFRERLRDVDPKRLVHVVDESSTNNIAFTPRYARAPKGERAYGKAPRNWGKNVTLIC